MEHRMLSEWLDCYKYNPHSVFSKDNWDVSVFSVPPATPAMKSFLWNYHFIVDIHRTYNLQEQANIASYIKNHHVT